MHPWAECSLERIINYYDYIGELTCRDDLFNCADKKKCLYPGLECDGDRDCKDDSDETLELCACKY